jgi:hypothetical protein
MKNWINKNYRVLINIAFLIPIIIVAFVSISHVTVWYDISNPVSWATYLSVGIEIAALSALAAISANMGKKVYFPFIIVTLIQFIGNIFFSYQFIDINGKLFRDWVELVSPIISLMGIESGDLIAHKRFLSLFSGGLLPLISLSFLHMIVKFTEEDRLKQNKIVEDEEKHKIDDKILEEEKKKWQKEYNDKMNIMNSDDDEYLRLSNEELIELEKHMKKFEKDYYQEEIVNPEDEIYKPDEIDLENEDLFNSYDFDNEEGEDSEIDSSVQNVTEEDIEEVPVVEEKKDISDEVIPSEEQIRDTPLQINDSEQTLQEQLEFEKKK